MPIIAYSSNFKNPKILDDKETFAVIGATIVDNFQLKMPAGTIGNSILGELE